MIVQDNVDNMRQRAADPVIGGPFSFDDGVSGPAHIKVNFISLIGIKPKAAQTAEIFQRHAANRHQRPCQHLGITMFSQHVAMEMPRVYSEITSHEGTKTSSIKHGAGADYPA